jgi:pimeloyl-ACP methyl ester carboxylesterase
MTGTLSAVPERFANVGDVTLCYETFGVSSDPAMLLVMGLGTQMLAWQEEFCQELAGRGFFVIRYDNRDIGRSSRFRAPAPTPLQLLRRDPEGASYSLEDMAEDGMGLLDRLGIEHVHVVGASMGGMIAQAMTIRHPFRVLSLGSIMSTTGARGVGRPALTLYPMLLRRAPGGGANSFAEHVVRVQQLIGSPGFPFEADEVRARARRAYGRGVDAAGPGRQLAAIVTARDRTRDLRRVTVPTVVIHGTADRLVAPSGGRATADAVPGSRLVLVDGMGHDLPRPVWPRIIDALVQNARRGAGQPAERAA